MEKILVRALVKDLFSKGEFKIINGSKTALIGPNGWKNNINQYDGQWL